MYTRLARRAMEIISIPRYHSPRQSRQGVGTDSAEDSGLAAPVDCDLGEVPTGRAGDERQTLWARVRVGRVLSRADGVGNGRATTADTGDCGRGRSAPPARFRTGPGP